MALKYAWAPIFPTRPEESFESWVKNRCGERLCRTFCKTYMEEVWDIPCTEVRAAWAVQRIHGLTFVTAVLNAICASCAVKTLIKMFDYPRLGPGMRWEAAARGIAALGLAGEADLGIDPA